MDSSKKSVLLLWVGKVWGKQVKSVTELADGCFFLHVLRATSHWSQQVNDVVETNVEDVFSTIKKCLQEFYGTEDFNGVLDFDSVFCDDINRREFELAKIAVVLLGVALIDKQGGDIVQKASMELPDHLHTGVVSLLEAVVQRHNGPNLMLTSAIEEALRTPMEKQCDNALESWFRMPKFESITPQECKNVSSTSLLEVEAGCSASPQTRMSTPLNQGRKGSSASTSTPLNTSFGISSPFRDLNIHSVSPFVSYIQSPQLIRKAVYNEKELELRQLKSRLNEEILLKEDVQLSLKDQIDESAKKASEIDELKGRIKELQCLQDAYDELQELKPRHAELEAKCEKFVSRQQKLDQYKSECRMLEQETAGQRDEIQALLQEIQSLKSLNQEKSEMLMTKNCMEKQISLLKAQLEESSRVKTLVEDELMSSKSNLQMAEEKLKELKKLMEECSEESFQGESMGVVTDIQLGEMKSQVDRLSQERDDLQTEIHGLKTSIDEQNSFVEELKKQVEASREMNESLVSQLRGKCTDVESLKSNMTEKESEHKNALATLKSKHEDNLKATHIENEKKVLSLVEGHEVFIKRFQTAAEKVSLEKDSVIQEVKDLEKKMQLLQDKNSRESEMLKEASEKQLFNQNQKFEQDVINLQEKTEMRKRELIAEHEKETQKLQDINQQKLLLQTEEHEIQLMKIKEEFLSEMKSQKSSFEIQIAELQSVNDKRVREKEELEREVQSIGRDMTMTLESEKGKFNDQIQKLKGEHVDEMNDVKTKFEIELASLKDESESQARSLRDDLVKLKKDNAVSLELLRKEHENAVFELNEKMAQTVQQYEKEVDDLQRRIQDSEVQKAKLEEDLLKLKDATAISLQDQHNHHSGELSALQQEKESMLACMEEEHRHRIEQLENTAQNTLMKQKDEMDSVISQLKNEIAERTSQKASVDEKLSTLLNEHNELKGKLSCHERENAEILSGKCAVEGRLDTLEKEHSEVLLLKQSLEERVESLRQENVELVDKTEEMEEELRVMDDKKYEFYNQVVKLENTVSDMNLDSFDLYSSNKELRAELSTLQGQYSEVISVKESTEMELETVNQNKLDLASQIESLNEDLKNVQQESYEISSKRSEIENELSLLQENLVDVSTQRSSLEKELSTLQLEKSDIVSQKTFIEEELSCLRQENTETLTHKTVLEEKVTNLLQQLSEITLIKASFEENLSLKEQEHAEFKSENSCLQEKVLKMQEDASQSLRSVVEKYDLEVAHLQRESEEQLKTLAENHQGELTSIKEERDNLMKEIISMKDNLDSALAEVQRVESTMAENEALANDFKKEAFAKLEQENSAHEERVSKIQCEWEERLSSEKIELEELIVNKMKHEFDAKVLSMKCEYDQLSLKLQEAFDALACEKEEHSKALAKIQQEADDKIVANTEEFGKLLSSKEVEMAEKLAIEKSDKENLLERVAEEKSSHEQLVTMLQEQAAEALGSERELVQKLKENLRSVDAERSELLERIATLQEETTRMMQIQKGEHERDMQSVRTSSETKILEVTTQCHKEVETMKTELEEASNRHTRQLEDEVTKVRQETEMSYERSLEELRVQFEAAKESELKALSDQKAELSVLKEQHEEEIKRHQTKFTELQEENQGLRERETAMLKNMESQMSTANDFCNNLRQQLEAANAKITKLEANPASREKMKLYEQQLVKQKETNVSLNNALKIEKETSIKMQQRLETHIAKHDKTKGILENSQKECRVYAIENNRLKTSLDYSERKLRTYKQQLEQAGNAMLGSDAHFRRTIEEHDAEMMNDSLDGANTSVMSSYSLRSTTSTSSVRSRGSTKTDDGSPNETIISADSVMMRRETLAGASDLRKKAPPPGFKATMLSCDNEPEEFEWDRLSELKRRNTLCLPHMKSSYPVETQTKKEAGSDEQAVRLSMMPGDVNASFLHGKRRSPRLSTMHLDEEDKNSCPNKKGKDETSGGTTIYFPLSRDGAVYQPPGAIATRSTDKQKLVASGMARKKLTPSKLTKSPGKLVTKGRSFKSPGVKGKSPAPARNNVDENKVSLAFSIGFTPKKAGVGRSRIMQKRPANQDTVLTETKLRSSPRQKVRKPLATRNFRETGI